jgi:hypothetical protein
LFVSLFAAMDFIYPHGDEKCVLQYCGQETLRENMTCKTRHKGKDNIRMGHEEICWEGVD